MGKKSRRTNRSTKSKTTSTGVNDESPRTPSTSERTDTIVDLARSLGLVVFDTSPALDEGWNGPRYSLERRHALSNIDYHAWCVDENNNVCDYPDDQLEQGTYYTENIVRRPWDAHLVAQFLPHLEELFKEFRKIYPKRIDHHLNDIQNNTFPQGNCYARAKILRDSDKQKYALVVGSLGYVQSDGRIFWECG